MECLPSDFHHEPPKYLILKVHSPILFVPILSEKMSCAICKVLGSVLGALLPWLFARPNINTCRVGVKLEVAVFADDIEMTPLRRWPFIGRWRRVEEYSVLPEQRARIRCCVFRHLTPFELLGLQVRDS